MRDKSDELSLEEISEQEPSYLGLQAYWGATKHIGSLKATRELIELCHISKGKHVLDVGCGVGITPCYIAKRHDCTVVGVDISEKMIDWSNERAKGAGVENTVEFMTADAQNLPFQDALFDAVIGESVTVFLEDKQRGVSEYVRVMKPGGYVGLNEATWIKNPPPTELVKYMFRVFGDKVEFLTSGGWEELLESSGLRDIVVRTYKVNLLREYIDGIRRLDSKDFSRAGYRFLWLYVSSPAFRRAIRERYAHRLPVRAFLECLGYGIYVGRK